jgi:DNA-binding transcriptional LysR family regulator
VTYNRLILCIQQHLISKKEREMATTEQLSTQLDSPQQRVHASHGFHTRLEFEKFTRPHDLRNLYVNLKQWRILHAVVDCRGFSEAAEFLHLSQSAVSYSVAKLQEQLDLPLLAPGRKVRLTVAGRFLLERSRLLLKEAVELEEYAEQLRHGGDAEINLVVDALFPSELLTKALTEFARMNERTTVRLQEVTGAGAERLLLNEHPDIAIVTAVPVAYLGRPLLNLTYVAVAHTSHPLAQLRRPITAEDLARHIRVSADSLQRTNPGSVRRTIWSMGTVQGAIDAVKAGLGYGWLPSHRITKLLDRKILVELPLAEGCTYTQTIYQIQARQRPVQPATSDLLEVLQAVCARPEAADKPYPKLREV